MGQRDTRMKKAILAAVAAGLATFAPLSVLAQDAAPAVTAVEAGQVEGAQMAPGAEALPGNLTPTEAANAPAGEGAYTPMAPTKGKGMPTSYEDGALQSMTFQISTPKMASTPSGCMTAS